MKRYLVFAHNHYYPAGGWRDFKKDFDSLEEANEHAKELKDQKVYDRSEVVDTETKEVVSEFY